jgi:hypothetical protein
MNTLLGLLTISNATLFLFGAIQHLGIPLGPFREPRIIPATIVEALCGFCLVWGALVVFSHSTASRGAALIANFIALGGVLLGIGALAAGAGPRTASNDLYHGIMLTLAGVSLLILFFGRESLDGSGSGRH